MAEMHICTCTVALGGDQGSIVKRGPHNPVTFPELAVLSHIHGEESVDNVQVIDAIDRAPAEEKARLMLKYPATAVNMLFPGKSPPMQCAAPGVKIKKSAAKKAPAKTAKAPAAPVEEPVTSADADTEE